jgi:hypothetical protein
MQGHEGSPPQSPFDVAQGAGTDEDDETGVVVAATSAMGLDEDSLQKPGLNAKNMMKRTLSSRIFLIE